MNHLTPLETEVKLRISNLDSLPPQLESRGFSLVVPAQLERSVLWDRGRELLEQGCALRLRHYAGQAWITWKGPKIEDPMLKIRPELETSLTNPEAMEGILKALGYAPVMTMEKTRAIWKREDLVACLDQTPFGTFLELEGDPSNIRSTMESLDLSETCVETRSYPTLFREAGLA
jgi:adenylate cyclase, class 2